LFFPTDLLRIDHELLQSVTNHSQYPVKGLTQEWDPRDSECCRFAGWVATLESKTKRIYHGGGYFIRRWVQLKVATEGLLNLQGAHGMLQSVTKGQIL